jgi:excisionase family DNA binding protein
MDVRPAAGKGDAMKPEAEDALLVAIRTLSVGVQELSAVAHGLREAMQLQVAPDAPLSIVEAGRLLGCGVTRIYALLKQGRLRRAPRVGRQVRITRASVDALLTGAASRGSTPWRPATRADVGLP